jgi:hypothetical protein
LATAVEWLGKGLGVPALRPWLTGAVRSRRPLTSFRMVWSPMAVGPKRAVDDVASTRRLVSERKRQSGTGDSAGVVVQLHICTATPSFARRRRPSKCRRLLLSPRISSGVSTGGVAAPWTKQPPQPHCCSRRRADSARTCGYNPVAAVAAVADLPLAHGTVSERPTSTHRCRSCGREGTRSGARSAVALECDERGLPRAA